MTKFNQKELMVNTHAAHLQIDFFSGLPLVLWICFNHNGLNVFKTRTKKLNVTKHASADKVTAIDTFEDFFVYSYQHLEIAQKVKKQNRFSKKGLLSALDIYKSENTKKFVDRVKLKVCLVFVEASRASE